MKNKTLKITLLILALSVFATGIYFIGAYFVDKNKKTNTLTVGNVKTQIVEEFTPPKELTPGVSFVKKVSIENTGLCDCYVRTMVNFSDSRMQEISTLDYNTAYWTYDNTDNYWYYNTILKVGEKTKPLFNTVTISNTASIDDIQSFDILVYHESNSSSYK